MKRALKFRIWSEEEGSYINAFTDAFGIAMSAYLTGAMDNREQRDEFETKLVLEQSTGLKDKNGREIWEGDIIRQPWNAIISSRNGSSETHSGIRIQPVVWSDAWTERGWRLGSHPWSSSHFGADIEIGICEVIGNIHENRELLKP